MIPLRNKKCQEADTITWVPATFIIIFILAGAALLGSWMFSKAGANTGEVISKDISKLSITRSMIDFLNSPAEKYGTVYNLAYQSGVDDSTKDERLNLFKQKAEEFLWQNFPGGTKDNPDYTAWIRIYPSGEKIEQYWKLNQWASYYEVRQVYWGSQTKDLCIPGSNNLAVVSVIPDKSVAVCWHKKK